MAIPTSLSSQPFFEQRAIGFLDIMGFKEIIETAEGPSGPQELESLIEVVGAHVKSDNKKLVTVPDEYKPIYTFISDSVIVSAPMDGDGVRYKGIISVAVKTVQIAHKLLSSGYLLRGGISVGNARHNQSNIFGSAYLRAYQAEQHANHPRIVLDKKAEEEWTNVKKDAPGLCVKDGDALVVDVLNPHYFGPTTGYFESDFQQIHSRIVHRLSTLELGSPGRQKWEWMTGFFNRALERHNINTASISVLPFPNSP